MVITERYNEIGDDNGRCLILWKKEIIKEIDISYKVFTGNKLFCIKDNTN